MGGEPGEMMRNSKMFWRTSSYAWILAFKSERVIIFSGPLGPKVIPDACVVSEKVGEGGPGDVLRLVGPNASARRERYRLGGMGENVE